MKHEIHIVMGSAFVLSASALSGCLRTNEFERDLPNGYKLTAFNSQQIGIVTPAHDVLVADGSERAVYSLAVSHSVVTGQCSGRGVVISSWFLLDTSTGYINYYPTFDDMAKECEKRSGAPCPPLMPVK